MDGFCVSDKAAKESKTDDDGGSGGGGVGLGVKLQSVGSFPCKKMMRVDDHDNHHRLFSLSEGDGDGDGHTFNNGRGSDHIYNVVGGVSGVTTASASGGVRTLQPFDISPTITSSSAAAAAHTVFKSPGGMAGTLGFPFTNAQWKELERQAMIYKYMMASLPLPPDLLSPISTRNFSSHPSASLSPLGGGALSLRFSGSADLEPGRCRRTDGKKWRCSRDVAPNQKYCERHMHRGRPRSRKPVELHVNNNSSSSSSKKTRHNQAPLPSSPVSVAMSNPTINSNVSASQFLGCTTHTYHHNRFQPMASLPSYKDPRGLDWMMKEHVPIATPVQSWHNLMQTKIGLTTESSFCNTNSSVFTHHYPEVPLSLSSYTTNFCAAEDPQNNESSMFLNPNLVPHRGAPRGFIDAWSNTGGNIANTGKNFSAASNEKLSLSSLTLSMGGNSSIDEEMGQIEMGLGVIGSSQNNNFDTKSNCSSCLNSASWISCTPGGPLAEVLRPSTVTAIAETVSNPPSPIAGNGDSGGSLAGTVSSPSGVLQKTFASLSDSSATSSPTLASSKARPEIVFQWLNQSKLATS